MKPSFKKTLSVILSALILLSSLFAMPISAEENTPKTYQYFAYDYENLTDYESWFATVQNGDMELETTSPINGNASIKTTLYKTGGGDYTGIAVLPNTTKLKSGAQYRVSAKSKVLSGSFNFGRIASIGMTAAGNTVNWSHIGISATTSGNGVPLNLFTAWASTTASSGIKKASGVIKVSETAGLTMLGAIYHANVLDDEGKASILLDDVVVAEIIDTVAATSDETMGTATVANQAGYANFAVNETAIFDATPNNGYYFVGWYDENGALVSESEKYETTVTTDLTLTAKFAKIANLIKVSFVSNGGTEVEEISGGSGVKINMPTQPTKEGFTFAGWYTDKDCTEIFPCKVFPEKDTTLYAKWIIGTYQDFENFTVTSNNPSKGEILNDSNYAYGGNHTFKAAVNKNVGHRVVVAQSADQKLSAYAAPGDKITISFKYKLVSGSVNFYPHTATVKNNVNALASYTTSAGKTGYANGYVYFGTDFTETSNDWKTFTHTYTLNSQSYFDGIGVEAAKSLGYTILFFTAKSDNTEIYVDDVMVYKTINIPINYATEAVRLEPANPQKPLTAAIQGDTLNFKAMCDASVTPTVKYGEKVIAPTDSVYSITVNATDALTVTAEGLTSAQNHAPGVGLNGENLTNYNADVFDKAPWEGDTVYHEAVMFVNSMDGKVQTTKKLLYPIDDIITLRNNDLNVWYVKGVDFKVENGKLVWLEGGKCPIFTEALAVPTDANDPFYDPALNYGGYNSASGYYTLEKDGPLGLKLMGDAHHEKFTVYVTYKHSKTWDEFGENGYTPKVPDNQSYDMQKFYDKLATNEDINVLVYGASTATGCASTGRNVNYDLFIGKEAGDLTVSQRSEKGYGISAPTFFEQATAKLVKEYGNNNKINYYNIAQGGTGAAWGVTNLAPRVNYMNEYYGKTIVPDIIYIKFAGNDVRTTPESLVNSYKSMISQFREFYPDVTIVLVAGKINNENCYIFGDYHNNVLEQEKAIEKLADATPNCIVAKTTSVWAEITESKDYEDYLSNNINHANDFWAKTTAQIIFASAAKNDDVSAVKTAYNNAAALRTASASSTGKNGLRVYNEIKKEWFKNGEIVEFGSVAIRTEKLDGALLTLENGAKGVAYSNGTNSAKTTAIWEETDGSYIFTAYLTGIVNEYYNTNYSVRSYAIDKNGNVYYGETVSTSVFAVANAIDNGKSSDQNEPTDTDKDAFYTFVTDANCNKYKEWCQSNNLNVGSLYNAKYN